MASTYSTNLAIELIGTGEQSGTWGTTTNTNLGTLIEQSISGYVTQAITDGSGANTTITIPNGATGVARNMFIEMTGALTFSTTSLIVPANKKMYFIFNNTSGGFAVTVKVSGQTGVLVPNGKKVILTSNGTDIVEAANQVVGAFGVGGTATMAAINASGTVAMAGAATVGTTLAVTGTSTMATINASGGVDKLTTATGVVSVSAATAPSVGQVLKATSSTVATWQTIASASGDVVGPASATSNALVRFNSTTGKIIKNSVVILDDSGDMTGLTGLTLSSGYISCPALYSTIDSYISGVRVGRGVGGLSENTVVGKYAFSNPYGSTGNDNTAIGYYALGYNDSGYNNTAVGVAALTNNDSGYDNTAVGMYALVSNTTGINNTAVGRNALYQVSTASNNTAVGYWALKTNTADDNTAIGYYALGSNTTATGNTASGAWALYTNDTGSANTAVGYQAGYSNTTAAGNTFTGYLAGYQTTTGGDNAAFGTNALYTSTTATNNTAIGTASLYSNDTGSANTAVGYQAGFNITTGANNVILGASASSISLTTGSFNMYLGSYARSSSTSVNYEMVITSDNTASIGKGASTGFMNPGGGGMYQFNNSANWSTTSDQRLKKNIVDNNTGLEKINAIQVRNFEYRLPEEVDAELKPSDAIQKEGIQLGVIAQELQQVLPECVNTESTGVMSVNADNLTWYLVNAIKELNADFQSYKNSRP